MTKMKLLIASLLMVAGTAEAAAVFVRVPVVPRIAPVVKVAPATPAAGVSGPRFPGGKKRQYAATTPVVVVPTVPVNSHDDCSGKKDKCKK